MTAERTDTVLELCEELLAVDSPYGSEQALCDRLERRLRAAGVAEILRTDDSLCIVPRPLRADRRRVLLCGHLDTVPALTPNPVRREGERLFGLGASDMKAAVAVIVATLQRAVEQAPRHDLVAILYAREEGPFEHSAMPAILELAGSRALRADLAICMEPTDLDLELGCMGTAQIAVTFDGRRAHSARPWQGDNAIHKAGPLLCRLRARTPREVVVGGLTWIEVVSATTAAFRGALNVVPDRFELGLNLRFAPGRTRADVEREVTGLLAGEASFAISAFWPAGHVVQGHPLVAELQAACGGGEPRPKQAWTDVGRLSGLGIDAINWGPGQKSQAHQADEWVDLRMVTRALRALDDWLFDS